MTTSKTTSNRDQIIDLQAGMQEAENNALVQLGDILKSEAMQDAISAMEALQDQMIPNGIGESQLKACIDVPRNVLNWLSVILTLPEVPTE
jgi:hypothetical protein